MKLKTPRLYLLIVMSLSLLYLSGCASSKTSTDKSGPKSPPAALSTQENLSAPDLDSPKTIALSTEALTDLFYFFLGLGVVWGWRREYKRRQKTGEGESFWPGTTTTPVGSTLIIVAGVILITIAETCVEKRFGVTASQSHLPAVYLFAMMGAAIVEETVFRGFAAPDHLSGIKLLAVILIGSVIFALIHGFGVSETKGQISTLFAFIISIWLYLGRFNPLNKNRSMAPSYWGHIVRNLAVFGIKWAQGFINFN